MVLIIVYIFRYIFKCIFSTLIIRPESQHVYYDLNIFQCVFLYIWGPYSVRSVYTAFALIISTAQVPQAAHVDGCLL